ncbi:MAG TPA: hypothetical protein VLY83_00170 [Methanoregula sp.]|nr:hypothetical protein [Methanoregula sp.]
MTKSKSVTQGGIPLYFLPRAIALHINRIGESVYRISVKRTHWHHYNISVRVRALPKELAPAGCTAVPAPAWRFPGGDTGHNDPCADCVA